MPDLLAVAVFLFLVGVVCLAVFGLAFHSRRVRADKAEKMLSDILDYAMERADVEPTARVIADIILGNRTRRS